MLPTLGTLLLLALFSLFSDTPTQHPPEAVARIVVTADADQPMWLLAEAMEADGVPIPDSVYQTPFAVTFATRDFSLSLRRTTAPVGFADTLPASARFTAAYMVRPRRAGSEEAWTPGGLTGIGGTRSVRFEVTDSTGSVRIF